MVDHSHIELAKGYYGQRRVDHSSKGRIGDFADCRVVVVVVVVAGNTAPWAHVLRKMVAATSLVVMTEKKSSRVCAHDTCTG